MGCSINIYKLFLFEFSDYPWLNGDLLKYNTGGISWVCENFTDKSMNILYCKSGFVD